VIPAAAPAPAGARAPAYSAHGVDAIAGARAADMRRVCEALAEEPVTEYRLFLAQGVAAFLDQRGGGTDSGLDGAAEAAARALSACVRGARHNEPLLIHLQLMACVCERLLVRVADVRNFSRPMMHPLFSLVENFDHLSISATLKAFILAEKPTFKHTRTLDSYLSDLCMEDESYLAASIPLALSALAVERLPEIFGFTYALWRAMARVARDTPEGEYYERQYHRLSVALGCMERQGGGAPALSRALERGARTLAFCLGLLEEASRGNAARSARRAAQIMREKSQFALIHHEKVMLGGRRLVELFTDATASGAAILDALEASDWIDPDAVDESRFFKRLLGVGGKMHGVFSQVEIDALKNYFRSKRHAQQDTPHSTAPSELLQFLGRHARAVLEAPPGAGGPPVDHRAAYYSTINAEWRPAGIADAQHVIHAVFAEFDKCRPALERDVEMRAFPYSSEAFERRVEEIYYSQSRQTKSLNLAVDDDALAAIHLAFAPFAMVDGCWLKNISAANRGDRAGELLFSIFADEIGNGIDAANHANIYQRLMGDFGLALPPPCHAGFAADQRIPHQAFKVPAFLVAINLCHTEYFHEILGLNLAIEMSGLDGFYEAMIDNLERRKMRADFWRVHVSADNFSTGHARQSVHLIQHHMGRIERYAGREESVLVWNRIWRGFLTMIYLFRIELAVLLSQKKINQTVA
jgi:hypothetical protein